MRLPKHERFETQVLSRYQIYNSIFMTLPFDTITRTGVLLPLFSEICQEGFEKGMNPSEIVKQFFDTYYQGRSKEEQTNLLFRFIQYIERQVVLFDAIEDAAFTNINNMDGRGTLRNVKEEAEDLNKKEELKEYLKRFSVRTVLTAHPTQFYPGSVLGIITDLAKAIAENDLELIKKLLAQLGKTPFFKKQKPTPFNEAVSLIWYLENVFYHSVSAINSYIRHNVFEGEDWKNPVINLGFWPGGDRDGNPFVTTQITLDVADRLRTSVIKNYYRDLRHIRRRTTFKGVVEISSALEKELYEHAFRPHSEVTLKAEDILDKLGRMRDLLVNEHEGLFVDLVEELISKVRLFGMYFASLDIRQDSRVHHSVMEAIMETHPDLFPPNYSDLDEAGQIEALSNLTGKIDPDSLSDKMARKTLASIYAMRVIQKSNGELGCNRYIISNNGSVINVMEAFAMLRMSDWKEPTVDVIPLFETVDDLGVADQVMETLYTNPEYKAHLERRGQVQTIMLGFSDGTKDGGYLMANWSIYTAKERLTAISRKYGITALFFDGRGGPPARGGGKTHQFYASLGDTIEQQEIQLTIQGQTISSNFGTPDSCRYNLEQLLSSGIVGGVFNEEHNDLAPEDRETMEHLAQLSYQAYQDFKGHAKFLPYLERMSTLKYYAKTNIGSRPSKRGKDTELVFSDLRAIPFVGSWSQLKQNVPGFYGVGLAIESFEKEGKLQDVIDLYQRSSFFRTLLENSMMSLTKSFFQLTAYMKDDPEFGEFWKMIHQEYERSKAMLLKVSGYSELMEDSRAMRASIAVREQIVLPLLTIQQFALRSIEELKSEANADELRVYEQMVTRSLFGNINASRNSA
ncbi:phosphoenolpyruvate carboxylase [Aureitalea marina]|uniref:Phosphoenolpyruvate carboxylase n=1 Tax=Aureitalea marina TaxID=930804 RepID=A0A2S7KRQ3_9FLAO|nr:phosphoenolpyruvate carboxylase [Aureitalea marina]PQB05299.1 phosphoenolpyruvate carboxylase [Aureitalea marina]